MAISNGFFEDVLKLEDLSKTVLWIAGPPSPVPAGTTEGRGPAPEGAPEVAVLRAPLLPFTVTAGGRLEILDDRQERQREVTIALRRYGPEILRITARLDGAAEVDDSPMLDMDADLSPTALAIADGGASAGERGVAPGPSAAALQGAGGEEEPPGNGDTALEIADAHTGVPVARFRTALPPTNHWSDLIPEPEHVLDGDLIFEDGPEIRLYGDNQFFSGLRDSVSLGFVEVDGEIVRATMSVYAEPNEAFYGTGERFLELDLSGRTIDLINQDALGVNSARAYKNVPVYLSSRGYGLFVHSSAHMTMSFKGASTRAVSIALDGDSVDAFVFAAESPVDTLGAYRRLTGFPPELPIWSYGTWMSRMTYFSAEEINNIAERLRREEFPCDVIHIDTGWFEKDWVCEWRFSKERFPDPPRFMSDLKDRGYRVSLWQNPNLGAGNRLLPEALEKGYIPTPPARAEASDSDFAAAELTGQIDFTNPDARAWYQGLLRDLFEKGAAVIKTDFGEEIRMDAAYRGMPAERLQNLYGLLYQRAAYEETDRATGEPIIWARAGWAGCQRYPVHWGGDAAATWDGLAGSLRGGLHLGMSGFGYWSHDVPGFHGIPDFMNTRPSSELYLRWTQFGVFTSHLRYHGTHPREPWFYPEVADLIREWLKLRYALIPYILQAAKETTVSGMPILRAMYLYYPGDPACRTIDDQYFFGKDLLVAPFTKPGGRRSVYLPKGVWVDLFTGAEEVGPTWTDEREWPDAHFPVFARKEAQIPVYPEAVQCTDEMDLSKVARIPIDESFKGIGRSALLDFIRL